MIWDNLNEDIYFEICKFIYYPQDEKLLNDLRSFIYVKKNLILYFQLHDILWYILEYNNNINEFYKFNIKINTIYGRISWRKIYSNKFEKIISKYLLKMSIKERYFFLNKMSEY